MGAEALQINEYRKLESAQERADFLIQVYPMLRAVTIIAQEIKNVLGRQFVGSTKRNANGGAYEITAMGDTDMQGYLTFHELLHVWLEETGRTINIEQADENIEKFLFAVRNMVNDFLIETEISRQCGQFYGRNIGDTKDRDITGNMMGLGNANGYRVFMEGTLMVALSKIYPEIADLKCVNIFQELIKHPASEEIVKELLSHRGSSITTEEYEALIIRICQLLTGNDKISLIDGKVHFEEPSEILDWMNHANETFESITRVLRSMRR